MTQRRRSLLFLVVVVGLLAASIVAVVLKPAVLGLDLQGGSQVIVQAKPNPAAGVNEVTQDGLDRSLAIIRNRVDATGVAEPDISTQGSDQIIVALPGVNDANVLERLIRPAELAFYDETAPFVVPDAQLGGISNQAGTTDLYALVTAAKRLPARPDAAGPSTQLPAYHYKFRKDAAHTLLGGPVTDIDDLKRDRQGVVRDLPKNQEILSVPAGYRILYRDDIDDATVPPAGYSYTLFLDAPAVTGDKVTGARPFLDSGSNWSVQLELNETGDDQFLQLTRDVVRRGRVTGQDPQLFRFVIRLDDEIISTPYVDYNENPTGIRGGGSINQLSADEAETLSQQIQSGALPLKLEIISKEEVSATLGASALRKALIAGAFGLAFVAIFLLVYYRVLGLIAVGALGLYGLFLYAATVMVPITLTLPGIAGIILTIGVAADANVVIFERVREEARAGRSAVTAIANGYKKGISAIIDANVVTLITAAIIFLLATGGPKGFAFALFIGVVLSLFTAVLATSAVFGLLSGTRLMENEKLLGLHQREIRWKLDFVGKWKLWAWLTVVPMVIGAIFIGVNGIERGIDFTGGTRIATTYPSGQLPTEAQIRTITEDLKLGEAKIQKTTNSDTGDEGYTVSTKPLAGGLQEQLEARLQSDLKADISQSTNVGPTFGRQLIRSAIVAIILSFLVIIAYLTLRFEYRLALPALVSVVHDVWLCLSVYAITGREVTAATVAALLTILGYSLYDVVIVFDRIRENVPIMRNASYRQIVNRSLHETLTRSLITALTTTVPVILLYFFGGETLKDFSFALLVGILAGGISSIIISAPLAALWKEREPEGKKRAARAARRAAKLQAHDADVVDVEALARAEAALAMEGQAPLVEPVGLDGETPLLDDEQAVDASEPRTAVEADPAEAPTPAPTPQASNGDAPQPEPPPAATDGPARPERERRHRQVQRKRRR